MKNKSDGNFIKDTRGLTLDNSTAIPNDFIYKYMGLFKGKQLEAVLDLLQQSYKIGLKLGRGEECPHCKKNYG